MLNQLCLALAQDSLAHLKAQHGGQRLYSGYTAFQATPSDTDAAQAVQRSLCVLLSSAVAARVWRQMPAYSATFSWVVWPGLAFSNGVPAFDGRYALRW